MVERNERNQQPEGQPKKQNTSNRGFASMDPELQRRIASKGGEAVSRDRKHMAEIGRKGGENSHGNDRNRRSEENGAR